MNANLSVALETNRRADVVINSEGGVLSRGELRDGDVIDLTHITVPAEVFVEVYNDATDETIRTFDWKITTEASCGVARGDMDGDPVVLWLNPRA